MMVCICRMYDASVVIVYSFRSRLLKAWPNKEIA